MATLQSNCVSMSMPRALCSLRVVGEMLRLPKLLHSTLAHSRSIHLNLLALCYCLRALPPLLSSGAPPIHCCARFKAKPSSPLALLCHVACGAMLLWSIFPARHPVVMPLHRRAASSRGRAVSGHHGASHGHPRVC
jgi:hypothetical protein